jgi:FMN phosphatase YigB (HAD superfamily)
MLPKIVRKFVDNIFDSIFFNLFKYKISTLRKFDEVVIFDLDNTLLDTYPLLNFMDLCDVFRKVKTHPGMMNLFNKYLEKEVFLFILSSRKMKFYGITNQYLNQNLNTKVPFYLVSEPFKKIKFLKFSASYFKRVTLYDDLSYNHENGEVKFYDEIINEIKKLSISYFDYEEILKINNSNLIDG